MREHDSLINDNTLTERQWALKGFLLKEGAKGTLYWSNHSHNGQYRYYSPDEVRPATKEELHDFFTPERERRNELARWRRAQKRKMERFEKEQDVLKEKRKETELICRAAYARFEEIEPLKKRYKVVFLDMKTTGLESRYDEIIQISIISIDGEVLFNSYFKPVTESWDYTGAANGISPSMVKDAPEISEKIAEINEILYFSDEVIGCNMGFNLGFLKSLGVIPGKDTKYSDVIGSPAYGEVGRLLFFYKRRDLKSAADNNGFNWNSVPDSSLTDCFAILYVYKKLRNHENHGNGEFNEGTEVFE